MRRALTFLLLVLIVGPPTTSAADSGFSAQPIALLVTTGKENMSRRLGRLFDGSHIYDEILRDPHQPDRAAIVHCAETHKIGMVMALQRPLTDLPGPGSTHIRHEWRHNEIDIRAKRLTDVHVARFARRQEAIIDIVSLKISGLTRQEGLWTLRSFVGDDMLTEKSFELIDCEGIYDEIDTGVPSPPEPQVAETPNDSEEEDVVVCRKEKATGSNIKTMICRSVSETERRRERDQDFVRDVQNTPMTLPD